MQLLRDTTATHEEHLARLTHDLDQQQTDPDRLLQEQDRITAAVAEQKLSVEAMELNNNVLHTHATSLCEAADAETVVSYDGSFIWKITGFGEKFSE